MKYLTPKTKVMLLATLLLIAGCSIGPVYISQKSKSLPPEKLSVLRTIIPLREVKVDGVSVARMVFYEAAKIMLEPGDHTIKAKMSARIRVLSPSNRYSFRKPYTWEWIPITVNINTKAGETYSFIKYLPNDFNPRFKGAKIRCHKAYNYHYRPHLVFYQCYSN